MWKVVYNHVHVHGQMSPTSADIILGRQLLAGLEDTPHGREFLEWKTILTNIRTKTGIPPAPGEDIRSYVERATRVELHRNPTLHAGSLIGRRINEVDLVTPRSAGSETTPAPARAAPQTSPEKQAPIIEQKTSDANVKGNVAIEHAPTYGQIPETELVRNTDPVAEASVEQQLKPAVEAVRNTFGADADRPAMEVIEKLRASQSDRYRPFENFLKKGYVPKEGESLIDFYHRAAKENTLTIRVPKEHTGRSI
jgi:hypothetical protein